MSWSPPAGAGEFVVERAAGGCLSPGPWQTVATTNLPSMIDSPVSGGVPYAYTVRAMDASGLCLSGPSECAEGTTDGPWTASANGGHVAPRAYSTGAPPYPDDTCAAVSTEPLTLGAGAALSFWSRNDIEPGYDKGEVQISADGGATWQRLEVGYPGTSSSNHSYDECRLAPGLTYFTGRSVPWAEHSASLAAWEGQEVIVRWLLSTDGSVEHEGWWIDDVEITSAGVPGPCVPGPDGLFSDGFESGDTGAWSDATP